MLRVTVYWLLAILTVSQLLILWKIITGPPTPISNYYRFDVLWKEYAPVLLVLLMMLAVFLADTAMLSNRFVGPFLRIRRSIHALASGMPVEPLQFRSNDYWNDVAKDINALSERMEQLKKQAAVASIHGNAGTENEFEFEPSAAH